MLFGVGCGSSGQETTFRGAAGNVDVRFTVLLMDCYVWVTSPPRWKEFNSARGYRVVRFSSAVESVLVVAEQPNDPKRGVDLRLVFRELAAPLSHSLNDSNIQLSFNFDRTLLSGEDIQSPLSMLRRSILVVTARLDFDRNGCNPMYCRYSSFLRPATATRYSQRLIVIRQNDDTGNSPQGTQI